MDHHRQRGLATRSWTRRPRSSHPDGACTFLAHPRFDGSIVLPIWTSAIDPSVIAVRCRPVSRRVPQALDVRELPHRVAISTNCQHIWLDAGDGSFRLDVLEGSALEGPVEIEPAIMLARAIEPQLGSVERLAGHLQGRRPACAPDPRLARLTLALRTMDARAEGASLRSIAIGLLRDADWPGDGEWMKSWVRRIVKLASALKKAGPRGVLSRAI